MMERGQNSHRYANNIIHEAFTRGCRQVLKQEGNFSIDKRKFYFATLTPVTVTGGETRITLFALESSI